ncbi:hypothetical protein QUF90_12100 [Desulfococcaceae bacterium HSG9]|nr:hypothetical protein [Desulfococcaceae bacterium HSG9]
MQNGFETERRELLAALYTENFGNVENICQRITAKTIRQSFLTEVDQKTLNQILHSFKRFDSAVKTHCSPSTFPDIRRLRQKMIDIVRQQTRDVSYVEYAEWRDKIELSDKQFKVLLKTVASLQMTVGCSNFCRRCNEWALPGVRKQFTFDAVKKLIERLFKAGNDEFVLYSASDPLDWHDGRNKITAILQFMAARGYKPRYGLLTKAPRGTESVMLALIEMDADMAVSMTAKNRTKIRKIESQAGRRLSVQHDSDQLLIPAGLDEDLTTIKSSITDNYGAEITPEGVFLIIPTFTSALNPTGQARIPIHKNTDFFMPLKTGRNALTIEYFKPFKALNHEGREFFFDTLLEPQIENILSDNSSDTVTPPGMMNLREYFSTYLPEIVMRRRKMLRPVIKKLQQEILHPQIEDKAQRKRHYALFKKKVNNYLEFCRMESVIQFKKNALAFYLKEIADYLQHHPNEREIIKHLRKNDKTQYENKFSGMFDNYGDTIENFLLETDHQVYERFQFLIDLLINNPFHKAIKRFIDTNPVRYDSDKDKFVKAC